MAKSTKDTKKKAYRKKNTISKRQQKQIVQLVKTQVMEKKHLSGYLASIPVGQVAGNGAGYSLADITALIGQGYGDNQRVGSQVDVTSFFIRFQFWQMTNTQSNIRIKYHIIHTPNNNENSLTLVSSQLFKTNPFSGIVDYNSSRNLDYMKSYRILRTGYVNLPQDSTTSAAQTTVREAKCGIVLKKPLHLNYAGNTNNIAEERIFLMVFADNGNTSSTVSTLTNVPVLTATSGAFYNMAYDTYYYDA